MAAYVEYTVVDPVSGDKSVSPSFLKPEVTHLSID